MKKLLGYLTSRQFLKNLLYAAGVLLFFLIFTFSCIRIYTGHGKTYAVPDLTDLPLGEAVVQIERKNFRFEVADSLYVPAKDAAVVIEQHPRPGFLVKKNRRIFLTINASGPENIQMPNFVGVTLREGKARLTSSGLVLGKLSYRYDISKNVILEQRFNGEIIEPGETVAKGTSIELVLGKGLGSERVKVPDLIGLTEEEAKSRIANNMFSIGAVVPDGTVVGNNDSIQPKIFKQTPVSDPSVLVALGSTISIWTTNDSTKLPQAEIDDETNYILPEVDEENEKDTNNYMSY